MINKDPSSVAHITPSVGLTDIAAPLDLLRMRQYRLGRVREQLKANDCAGALLIDPINIRYAIGSKGCCPIFQTHLPSSYVFVATEGPVVAFGGGAHNERLLGLGTITECRPAVSLTYFQSGPRLPESINVWAAELASLFKTCASGNERLAVDRLDVACATALGSHGIKLFDAQGPIELARSIKSAEEILCMNYSLSVSEVGMARMREALRPGLTENELFSILAQTNIAMGGEWMECKILTSGDRTNPWFQASNDRRIRPGELLAFDTDMVGPFGYCADVSRTYFCGPGRPSDEQRKLYKLAYEEIQHNASLVKAGVSFRELTEKSYRQPDEYIANRYQLLAHGIGLCDEYPSIYYRQDEEKYGFDGVLEENMTICIESYVGAEGGRQGVKLEHQVLVTAKGCEILSKFPFEDELLR
ncbi:MULTISPECIES: Xaa-Pro peptidase family protein [unclassified Bradyrhizobium]|uniref:M24 family metallopeptidase n=1 Tax=unclassified Bradyrhizobium TaxID=2631580 RepID=UPI001FFEB661|nr:MULTISPECIES: Xaa-Pro peptidase family protein [unclassified Bradyrhizobium]